MTIFGFEFRLIMKFEVTNSILELDVLIYYYVYYLKCFFRKCDSIKATLIIYISFPSIILIFFYTYQKAPLYFHSFLSKLKSLWNLSSKIHTLVAFTYYLHWRFLSYSFDRWEISRKMQKIINFIKVYKSKLWTSKKKLLKVYIIHCIN